MNSEPSADGDLSAAGSETLSSGESSPVLTMARTRRANLNRTCLDPELTRSWSGLERRLEHSIKKLLAW